MIAFILLVVGGLNIGLNALGYNVLGMLLGTSSLSQIVNVLIGLSAVLMLATHKGDCKTCSA